MKESLSALSITLDYDGMDATCTTSAKSMSLDHLHTRHMLRGVEKLRRTIGRPAVARREHEVPKRRPS